MQIITNFENIDCKFLVNNDQKFGSAEGDINKNYIHIYIYAPLLGALQFPPARLSPTLTSFQAEKQVAPAQMAMLSAIAKFFLFL